MPLVTAADSKFSVEVSDDRMKAYLRCTKLGGYSNISAGDIVAVLESAHIEINDLTTQRIHEFLAVLKQQGPAGLRFEIAQGVPVVEGQDAHFIWEPKWVASRSASWDVSGYPDFYRPEAFVIVDSGVVIGRLVAKTDGQNGVDISGQIISRKRIPHDITLGTGLHLEKDTANIISDMKGKVELCKGSLFLVACEVIDGEFCPDHHPLKNNKALLISKGVRGSINLESQYSISVGAGIDQASLKAGCDIVAGDGINGRNRSHIIAQGQIVARFCEEATLRAGGDVQILTAVNNSKVYTQGTLRLINGVIVGGEHYARVSVTAKAIGNDVGVQTTLRIGVEPEALTTLAERDQQIKVKLESLDRLRQLIVPLLAQVKRLTSEQRERATELLYQADSLELEVKQLKVDQDAILNSYQSTEPPFLEVETKIYPGTKLYLNEYRIVFNDEMRGPIRVTLQQADHQTRVVAMNKFTNTVKIIPSHKLKLNELQQSVCDHKV